MFRKGLSIILFVLMMVMLLPINALAGDVQQILPINNDMESTSGVTGISSSYVTLTQDRVSGNYAVKVSVGDVPNQTFAGYILDSSSLFDVSKYSQIKLWVKPGVGAQWIKFYTSNNLIKSDKNCDGEFKVGEDLVSGKWNELTLDLTKTSSPITQAQGLTVNTNEFSTWNYDEIESVYSPVSTVDISKMTNSQTQVVNGALQFKSNGAGGYNITPATLVSNQINSQSAFSRNSDAYYDNGSKVAVNVPRYKAGKFVSA